MSSTIWSTGAYVSHPGEYSAKAERCEPDYEGMIAAECKHRDTLTDLLNAINKFLFSFNATSINTEPLISLTGHLSYQVATRQQLINRIISDQEKSQQREKTEKE